MIKIIVLTHLIIYLGMFFGKNILLTKKIEKNIRGKNKEAVMAIISNTLFNIAVIISVLSEKMNNLFTPVGFLSGIYLQYTGIILLFLSLVTAFLAIIQMRDSWRIGIMYEDKTELVTNGIFSISRNPYFLSNILVFAGYALLIHNIVIIVLSLLGVIIIHAMVIKEESYLKSLHGDKYLEYKKEVARYFIV